MKIATYNINGISSRLHLLGLPVLRLAARCCSEAGSAFALPTPCAEAVGCWLGSRHARLAQGQRPGSGVGDPIRALVPEGRSAKNGKPFEAIVSFCLEA